MDERLVRYLIAACREEAPREACGLVYDNSVAEMINISGQVDRFEVDQEALREVVGRLGDTWTGAWHSHPGSTEEPSERDWTGHPGGVMFISTPTKVIAHAPA